MSPEKSPPIDWQVKTDDKAERNVRWSVPVGNRAIGGPVVANGLVWVGTNNDPPFDPKITGDRGVLACFRASDGKFLYQHTSARLNLEENTADWGTSGLGCAPAIEGDRLWFMTNRREVLCLDVEPVRTEKGPARVVWKYDLIKELGVFPNSPMIPHHQLHRLSPATKRTGLSRPRPCLQTGRCIC